MSKSTITRERVAQIYAEYSKPNHSKQFNVLDSELTEIARIALATMDGEPVAWDYEWASYITCEGPQDFKRIIEREAPPEWAIEEGQARNIIPLYRHAQPAQTGVDDDVRNIVGLLETNEWAEHCTETVLGSRLEAEITRLVGSAQPVPECEPVKCFNADQMHRVCLEANRHLDKYGAMAKEVNKLLGRIPAQQPVIPSGLHPDTQKLVTEFCTALAEKLYKAQLKYGHSDNWSYANWEVECQTAFHEHIAKGDPRDVAAYCAFMWYHGWKTEAAQPAPVVQEYPETLPCPVIFEPGFRFGKGVSTHLVLRTLKNRAERYAELDAMGPEARAEHDAAIAELREKLGFGAPAKTAMQIKLPELPKLGSDAEWYQGFAAGAGSMREACAATLISAGVEIIRETK